MSLETLLAARDSSVDVCTMLTSLKYPRTLLDTTGLLIKQVFWRLTPRLRSWFASDRSSDELLRELEFYSFSSAKLISSTTISDGVGGTPSTLQLSRKLDPRELLQSEFEVGAENQSSLAEISPAPWRKAPLANFSFSSASRDSSRSSAGRTCDDAACCQQAHPLHEDPLRLSAGHLPTERGEREITH